ncbi:MAG: DUF4199 domain-containing protein [Bacteroidota bacterium]
MGIKGKLIVFGVIGGVINIIWWFLSSTVFVTDGKPNFSLMELFGYIAMIIALSTVYFGIKSYRDDYLEGYISFKKAFFSGMTVVIVASVVYVAGWMIYYPNFAADFGEQYYNYYIEEYKASGLSGLELDQKIEEMNAMMESYKNTYFMAGITFMEIFPVGLVIALISSFLLKKAPSKE